MLFVTQDSSTNEHGVICTIGIMVAGQPAAIVLPMVCTASEPDADQMTASCVDAIGGHAVTPLCLCLSPDAYISHIMGDGMVDGMIPARVDYPSTLSPGTAVGAVAPQQVAGLIVYYQSSSGNFSDKIGVAHNYIPGIPGPAIVGGVIDSGLIAQMIAFATLIVDTGVTSTHIGGTWKRYLSAPFEWDPPKPDPLAKRVRTPGLAVKMIGAYDVRGYPATQRRRLTPHP